MKPTKNYKTMSKQNNKKKKVLVEHVTGELSTSNSSKRFPVLSLPEIVTQPILQTYRRFVNNGGAVSGALAISDLLNQFTMATTSVLVIPYVRAVRIKKIRILSPVTTQGTSITLSMLPIGADTGQNSFTIVPEMYLDTSASIDVPAFLSLTPSIETPLGSWHLSITNASSSQLLQIVCPQGSTMDILFEYILNTVQSVPSYTRTIAAGTAGTLYAANILGNFVPQGVNAI